MFFEKATSGLSDWFRYILSILAVMIAYALLGQLPLMGMLLYKIGKDTSIGMEELDSFQTNMDFGVFGISNNFGLVLMIMIFVISMLALMLCVKYIHRMPFGRLITPLRSIDWKKIFFGFGVWMALSIAMELIIYVLHPETYSFSFKPASFFVLLLICLVLLPIQTSFEELFFRGYLMTWFGRLIGNKWIPLAITSILFGLVHGMNPEVSKYGFWTMELYYVSAGLFLGLITIMDDSLELALGVHAATNIFGASILSFEGSVLQTDTLLKASEINPSMMTVMFYIAAIIFIIICTKKYNWKWPQNLTEPVSKFTSSRDEALDVL